MGTLIRPGEPPSYLAPGDGRVMFSLQELQSLVGGYIEVVTGPYVVDGEPTYLVINEDGKREHLPVNGFATALFHAAGGPRDDCIVGTAIYATRRELNGDDDDE